MQNKYKCIAKGNILFLFLIFKECVGRLLAVHLVCWSGPCGRVLPLNPVMCLHMTLP